MTDKKRFLEAFEHVTGIRPKLNENVGIVAPTGFVSDRVKVQFFNFEEWDAFKEALAKYPDAADFDVRTSSARVNWLGELQTRSWGIGGLSIAVNSVYFAVHVKFFDSQTDLIEEETLTFDSTQTKDFLASIELGDIKITDPVMPEEINIDFAAQQIKVRF